MDAAAIVDMLKEAITSCGLLLSSCRGQSYDGAAAMSGHITGVQTRLRELEPKALFHICSAHALNLCVVRACTNAYIQNVFGTLQSLYTFFGGPKRHAVLQECKQEENSIRSRDKQHNLHSLSDTRWISRFSALQSFVLLYPAILNALEKLSTMNESDKTVSEANGLLGNIATFDFMISTEVARMVLNVTQPFSNYLQSPKLNLLQFKSTADITLESLKELRSADIFSDVFKRCCDKAKELEISISSTIRRRSRQDKADIESYYRRELYFSVLDELIGQFQERLLSREGEIITAFGIFSREAILSPDNYTQQLQILSDVYGSGETPDVCSSNIPAEYKAFTKWCARNIDLNNPVDLIELYKLLMITQADCTFPNMTILCRIALTLPITSCTAERSFSVLRLVKTHLRSTMSENRLSALAIIYCNKDIQINKDNVIKKFSNTKPRRLEFELN